MAQSHKREIIAICLILSLFELTLANPKCMIDQCKDCDFKNVYTCNQCEPGYYIRNYYGDEKGKRYQDCWSKNKLAWLLLLLTLLPCCYLGCCYALYRYAQTHIKVKDPTPNVKYQNRTKVEEPQQRDPVIANNIVPQNQQVPQVIQNQVPPQQIQQPQMALDNPSIQQSPIRPYHNQAINQGPSLPPRKKYPSKSILKGHPRAAIGQQSRVSALPQRSPIMRRIVEREPYYSDPNNMGVEESPYASPNRSFMNSSGGVRIIEKEPTLIIERSPGNGQSNRRIGRRNMVGSAPKRITQNKRVPEVSYFDENGHKYRAYRVY